MSENIPIKGRYDKRFVQEDGENLYNGNELIIKGGLEAGVSLYSSYPGSPVAETLDVIALNAGIFNTHGIEAMMANNEALAVARVNGSQVLPLRAMAIMKSVGFNVASDVLETVNLAGTNPQSGAIVVVGDDPTCSSTQAPADTRAKSRALFMPVISPATWQEIKDWVELAYQVSAASQCYVTYLITTAQADGGGNVELRPNRYPQINRINRVDLDTAAIDSKQRVMIPPASSTRETSLLYERIPAAVEKVRQLGLDRILNGDHENETSPIGFIAAGVCYLYLEDALAELGLTGKVPILKLGCIWPIDQEIVKKFCAGVDNLIVIEEKAPFIEDQIKVLLHDLLQRGEDSRITGTKVWGKRFPDGSLAIPAERGLSPTIIIERLADKLAEILPELKQSLEKETSLLQEIAGYRLQSPPRASTFCAGCPHRDTGNLLMDIIADVSRPEYMNQKHPGKPTTDIVVHGDIGCYSMFNAIWDSRLMHDMSAMGQSFGAAAGLEPFVVNKRVMMVGDSTFFHSGLPGISDIAKHRQDILVIILDNDTTAMTGQHPTPVNNLDLLGRKSSEQDIETAVRGIVGPDVPIAVVDPGDEHAYRKVAEDLLMRDGLKVIVSRKPCAIKEGRLKKRELKEIFRTKGYLSESMEVNVTPEVCEDCLECTRKTGCLGLERKPTVLGTKVQIDRNACYSDGACYRVEACPSFEEVTVRRTQAPPSRIEKIHLGEMPLPEVNKINGNWRSYVCGFGGQGSNTVAAILARAGHAEDYDVCLHNRKGMAIRNGSVKSVVIYSEKGKSTSPLVPEGKIDLIVGLDILEVARAIDGRHHISVANPQNTRCVTSNAKNQTLESIMDKSDFDPAQIEKELESYLLPKGLSCLDVNKAAEMYCGHGRYLNTILLGIAWQRGWLPLSFESIEDALSQILSKDELQTNLLAFGIGRKIVLEPEAVFRQDKKKTLEEEVADIERLMVFDIGGRTMAKEFGRLFIKAHEKMNLPEEDFIGLAHRLEDVLHYGGKSYALKYLNLIFKVYDKDLEQEGYRATRLLIHNLHRVMVIKDEVHVAHLLTSARKMERDRLTYDVDPTRGDKISYRHFTTPQFTLFGRDFRFKIITHNWMLNLMKRLKFLRSAMPGWHRPQKEFIGWYLENVVEKFIVRQKEHPSYRAFCEAINTPESAKGYREVRYPGMLAAKRAVALLLGIDKERSLRAAESGKAGSRPAFQWRNFEKPEKIKELAGKSEN